jgi:hypothetical protein
MLKITFCIAEVANMETEQNLCEYKYHDNDVHEFIYNDVGRDAVDEYFAHFERIAKTLPAGSVFRILTNGSRIKDTQPVRYMFVRLQTILRTLPHRPTFRVALLAAEDNSMTKILDTIFRALLRGHDRLRFFRASEYEQAVEWLLKEN